MDDEEDPVVQEVSHPPGLVQQRGTIKVMLLSKKSTFRGNISAFSLADTGISIPGIDQEPVHLSVSRATSHTGLE